MLIWLYAVYEKDQREQEEKRLLENQPINPNIQYRISKSFLDEEEKTEDIVSENGEGLQETQTEEASELLLAT